MVLPSCPSIIAHLPTPEIFVVLFQRSRKCRSTEEYLKRVQETWVSQNHKEQVERAQTRKSATYTPSVVTVEASEHIHASSAWDPCYICCCCAPDHIIDIKEATQLGFEFDDAQMPEWVSRSMRDQNLDKSEGDGSLLKWHFCPNWYGTLFLTMNRSRNT